ncbi:MAG: type II toxin-antitoxin system RelE/ParE family toxin [Simkaniaceae bacterium]|nr:type II toxin-antitoxin system RelE/ParE family toxin [Simkaniaceae bacterium]
MAIRSFKDPDAEIFFTKGLRARKKGWDSARNTAKRKLGMLNYACALKDLRSPPNNRLEALKGELKGYYSIRINDQWRIIFRWNQGPYDVQIVDYH